MPEGRPSPEAAAPAAGWWDNTKESLLPSGTFAHSDDPDRDLALGRCFIFAFYVVMFLTFSYTVWQLFSVGRVEIMKSTIKLDKVEAPSVAICPFWPSSDIVLPRDEATVAVVHKLDPSGPHEVKVPHGKCNFDRSCVCADMQELRLEDHFHANTRKLGYASVRSEKSQSFREQVEIRTSATDPSADQVLKFGLYNSVDALPSWFYVTQGKSAMANLELEYWYVTDVSAKSAAEAWGGNMKSLVRPRQMYRIFMQEVGHGGGSFGNATTIIYQMRHFFIDEAVASESAMSIYTIAFLAMFVVGRRALTSMFMEAVMPLRVDKDKPVEPRELPGWLSSGLLLPFRSCAGYVFGDGGGGQAAAEERAERVPLVA